MYYVINLKLTVFALSTLCFVRGVLMNASIVRATRATRALLALVIVILFSACATLEEGHSPKTMSPLSEAETAWHEAGHIVAVVKSSCLEINMGATITPRGRAGGWTASTIKKGCTAPAAAPDDLRYNGAGVLAAKMAGFPLAADHGGSDMRANAALREKAARLGWSIPSQAEVEASAQECLEENWSAVQKLATLLLERKTLDAKEIAEAFL